MKSILLLVMAANLGFYFLASGGGSSANASLAKTDNNVPVICLSSDEKLKDCNFKAAVQEGLEAYARNKGRPTIAKVTRPAKDIKTRSNSTNTAAANARVKNQQVASLGNTGIRPEITAPINLPKPATGIKSRVQCFTMGPFIDRDDATTLNAQLENLDVQSVVRTVKEKEQFWVYLQDYRDTSRTVAALQEKGIIGYKVITQKGKRDVVSIGWFNNHSKATTKYKQLASLGFTPKLIVKGSPGEQIWIDYLLPKGKRLSSNARKVIKRAHSESYFQVRRCK